MKIFQINGFRGLLMTAFVICCLFAGFVIFPGVVAMHLWNKYLVNLLEFPVLDIFQGVLLWGIVAVSYFIISNGRFPISFETPETLSDAELNMIMKNAHMSSDMRRLNSIIKKNGNYKNMKSTDSKSKMTSPMSEKHEEEDVSVGNLK